MAVESSCGDSSGSFLDIITNATSDTSCSWGPEWPWWIVVYRYGRKLEMTSSLYDVDGLGYKCATMGTTERSNNAKLEPIDKSSLSSNCFLQLENMK